MIALQGRLGEKTNFKISKAIFPWECLNLLIDDTKPTYDSSYFLLRILKIQIQPVFKI